MSEAHDKFDRLLDSSSRNLVNAFFDNFQKSNTSFRAKAGLKQVVIRKELGSCCDWCRSLAGTYTYGDEPQEVWMRHANCRCMVITRTEKGTYQDAWSRKEYENERAARVAREEEILKEQKILEEKRRRRSAIDFYTGLNGKTLKAEYKQWIGENRMAEYLNKAESDTVKKYIKTDYRPTSFIGDGSTADIRKFEIETGLNCGRDGKDHSVKVGDLIRQLRKALLQPLSENDRIFLEKQLEKLIDVSE